MALSQFNNLSVNVWVNFNTLSSTQVIIGKQYEFYIEYPNTGNGFRFYIQDSQGNEFTDTVGAEPTTGEWYMLTLVYDQSEMRSYVNSGTPGKITANGNPVNYYEYDGLTVGGLGSYSRKNPLDGRVAELRIYDSVLTHQEIQDLYDVINTDGTLISSKKTI